MASFECVPRIWFCCCQQDLQNAESGPAPGALLPSHSSPPKACQVRSCRVVVQVGPAAALLSSRGLSGVALLLLLKDWHTWAWSDQADRCTASSCYSCCHALRQSLSRRFKSHSSVPHAGRAACVGAADMIAAICGSFLPHWAHRQPAICCIASLVGCVARLAGPRPPEVEAPCQAPYLSGGPPA